MDFRSGPIFQHLRQLNDDAEFVAAATCCVHVQQDAAEQQRLPGTHILDPAGRERVSKRALAEAMSRGDVSDIRTDGELSNCLVFHASGLAGSVIDERVSLLRETVDRLLRHRMQEFLDDGPPVELRVSGQLWYPPGSYMGWHTNTRVPGWRVYVTYAEEPRRSFFRYRDPETGEVVTSWDDGWDLRAFRTEAERPLWHAVYSHTNRFSFGYRLVPKGSVRLRGPARRLLNRLRRL